MGGGVSDLRNEIKAHLRVGRKYFQYLEPTLYVVQYFLQLAEEGEGLNRDRRLDDLQDRSGQQQPRDENVEADVATRHRIFEEASTEVEVLCENHNVMQFLLDLIGNCHQLELAPTEDPVHRWYDTRWTKRPMPQFAEVLAFDIDRYRTTVLRSSIRCLRILMLCSEGRTQMEETEGYVILNQTAADHPLDDFIKKDVKAVFQALFGGDNAVKRIVIGNIQVVSEMMTEYRDNPVVQLAGVKRVCDLISLAPDNVSPPLQQVESTGNNYSKTSTILTKQNLLVEMENHGTVPMITTLFNEFTVETQPSLYMTLCRFIALVTSTERNIKLIGQNGGVEGAIRLLLFAREMERDLKTKALELATKKPVHDQSKEDAEEEKRAVDSIMVKKDSNPEVEEKKEPPPPPPPPAIDYTPAEIGQQAIWALDALAKLEFNICSMKKSKLKYILEEIRLDPAAKEMGHNLIVTRRLRLIRWDEVGAQALAEQQEEENGE